MHQIILSCQILTILRLARELQSNHKKRRNILPTFSLQYTKPSLLLRQLLYIVLKLRLIDIFLKLLFRVLNILHLFLYFILGVFDLQFQGLDDHLLTYLLLNLINLLLVCCHILKKYLNLL